MGYKKILFNNFVKMKIKVCMWNNCKNKFAEYIVFRLKNDVNRFNLDKVEVEEVACQWRCEEWPIVRIDKNMLTKATPIKASEMMFKRLSWNTNNQRKEKKEKEAGIDEDNVNPKEVIY